MSRTFKQHTKGTKGATKGNMSQKSISSFFQSNKPDSSERKPLAITTPEKVSLSRSNSILSKTVASNSGFEELGSSDTSFGSPEIKNLKNPLFVKSFSEKSSTQLSQNDVIDLTQDEILRSLNDGVEVQAQRKPSQISNSQIKRGHSNLFEHLTNGQPRKATKLQRFSPPSSTASSSSKSNVDLSEEQAKVIDLVIDGKQNVFYTGSAGTGKSVVLRELVSGLQRKYGYNRVGVTASTGLAACNIGGQTLHKYLSIGLGSGSPLELAKRIKRNGANLKKWMEMKVLIIDEISMIDGKLFTKLEELAKIIRKNPKPFGGIQVICTGDFFQLPPVSKDGSLEFCFQSPAWKRVISKTVLLTQVFRQKGDSELIDMLNALRYGELDEGMAAKFFNLSRKVEYKDGLEPTELFPTRDEVKRANQVRLNSLQAKPIKFIAKDNVTDPFLLKLLDNLMCEKELDLKEGAQVMYLKNYNDYIVNGSIGTTICFLTDGVWNKVKELYGIVNPNDPQMVDELRLLSSRIGVYDWNDDDTKRFERIPEERKARFVELCHFASKEKADMGLPIVNFKTTYDDNFLLKVDMEEFSIDSGRLTKSPGSADSVPEKITRTQLPLLLSWALSIHKAQGQTIDRLRIDLRRIFEKGQVYVALSRASNKDHLEVRNFDPSRIATSQIVKDFYKSLE